MTRDDEVPGSSPGSPTIGRSRCGSVSSAECLRQRAVLAPAEPLLFDTDLTTVVRRAIGAMPD